MLKAKIDHPGLTSVLPVGIHFPTGPREEPMSLWAT